MASRKPAAKHPRNTDDEATTPARPARAKAAAGGTKPATPKRAAKRPAPRKTASRPPRRGSEDEPTAGVDTGATSEAPARKRLAGSERERRFNLQLQTACLKAGTAAAISTITSKVPFLGRLAPVVLGSVGEALTLAKVQQQLVRDIIELYGLELSEPEERGVILLATAVNIGTQQISKQTVEQLIEQISGRFYRPVISRVLPLASIATEVAAAVANTYAIGKRAQALCKLPGTGAKDLGELLRSLSGIDQAKLFSWTADAFMLALKPFRGALMAMLPGMLGRFDK